MATHPTGPVPHDKHRYPFAPLEALVPPADRRGAPPGEDHWQSTLGVSRESVSGYRKHGLSWRLADTLAIRAGLHPALIWPDWFERGEV